MCICLSLTLHSASFTCKRKKIFQKISPHRISLIDPVRTDARSLHLIGLQLCWTQHVAHITVATDVFFVCFVYINLRGSMTFPMSISPKIKVIAWLELELTYLETAVQNISHCVPTPDVTKETVLNLAQIHFFVAENNPKGSISASDTLLLSFQTPFCQTASCQK